ncbi:hypothetical protein ACVWXM_008286 [Bradyrhizobium sp. GM7.3]
MRVSIRASAALSDGVLSSSMIALISFRAASASCSTWASVSLKIFSRAAKPSSSGGVCILAITMRRIASARSSERTLDRARWP